MSLIYVFLFSFLISFLLTPLARTIALRLKIFDRPNRRKIHHHAMPLLGGLAVYLAFVVTIILNFHFSLGLKGVVIGSSLVMLMGLRDDLKPSRALSRLLIQILASLILIKYGVAVTFLPDNLWGFIGEWLITIFWVVGITNAFDFLDGLDGLAAGLAAISFSVFFIIAEQTRQSYLAYLSLALMGSALGFLPYNFHPAKIFLGSCGSNFLGFCLAALAIMGAWAEKEPAVSLSVPILILGVFIFDMVYITISRIKHGKVKNFTSWIEYVGKDHFHHRLLYLDLSQRQAVALIYLISLSLGISAIALTGSFRNNALLTLFQAALIFLIIAVLMLAVRRKIENG